MKTWKIWTIAGITALTMVGAYTWNLVSDGVRISESLKIARVAVDTDAVAKIGGRLRSGEPGWDLLTDASYQRLVFTLKELSENFPIKSKWTYIMQPSPRQLFATLTVMTIQPVHDDETTLPGFSYPVDKYPAMQRALYFDDEIVVSGIVWDDTYKTLTRSGFIKLYRDGEAVGVLAVDIDSSHIISSIMNTILITITVLALLILILMQVTNIFFGVSKGEMEIINACLDEARSKGAKVGAK